jgi:hypothetical protein
LTLGGTLDLSAPPAIGGTTANTITGTTITATTKFVSPFFDAANSAGGALRNATGTAQLQWGGGGGNNVSVDVAININPANAAVAISPTGTGTVTINPATASTMNNVAIGGTTALAGTFTDLRINGTLSLAGSTGTAGYVLTSNGASAPTWQANANGLAITDDTTTNATRYLTFTSATTGSISGANVSSTKLSFNPSTGYLTVTGLTSPIINNPTVTNYVESVVAIGTVTTSNTLSLTNGTVQTATLTASTACTFTMPTATAGKSFVLLLKQAASTGNGTATFTGVKWGTAGAPTITATAGKMDILTFIADGTNWYGSAAQGYTP